MKSEERGTRQRRNYCCCCCIPKNMAHKSSHYSPALPERAPLGSSRLALASAIHRCCALWFATSVCGCSVPLMRADGRGAPPIEICIYVLDLNRRTPATLPLAQSRSPVSRVPCPVLSRVQQVRCHFLNQSFKVFAVSRFPCSPVTNDVERSRLI